MAALSRMGSRAQDDSSSASGSSSRSPRSRRSARPATPSRSSSAFPAREGFEANSRIAAIYGNGGDVAPLVPVVSCRRARPSTPPASRGELAAALAQGQGGAAAGADRLLRLDRRPGVRLGRRPHDLRARLHPRQRRRRTRARRRRARAGGARRRHGRRRAGAGDRARRAARRRADGTGGTGTGVLLGTLLPAFGALLVLAFVFRSFTAVVPLLMALVAIPTTFLLIWPLASVTDVSVIVQFLVALIGLGIAIDYALLVVVRWREERQRAGTTNEEAVQNAMQHAGSAVVFSGTTVGISLLALVAVPVPSLRSIGIAGLLIAAGQRRCRRDAAAGRACHGRPEARLAAQRAAMTAPSRAWSSWARLVVRHRWSPPRRPSPSSAALVLAASTIQLGNPRADSLAQTGPGPRRARAAQAARIGTGPLSPFDALVRSGDAARVAQDLRDGRGRPQRGRTRRLASRRDRPRHRHPDRGRELPGGPRDARPAPRDDRAGEVAIGGEAAQSADFLDAVYSNFPLLIVLISRAHVPAARAGLPLADPAAQGGAPEPALRRCRLGTARARVPARLRLTASGASRRRARSTSRCRSSSSRSSSASRWTTRSSSSAGCARPTTAPARRRPPSSKASAAPVGSSRARR